MKFLTKFGQAFLKGLQIVVGFSPLAATLDPQHAGTIQTISQDLTQIAHIVTQIEVAGQAISAPGPQKLQMAAPLVAQILLQSATLANHKVNDEELFMRGATKLADGMADCLNALHSDVQTEGRT